VVGPGGDGESDSVEVTLTWLRSQQHLELDVEQIPLEALDEWAEDGDGVFRHHTGRFFRIVGVETSSAPDRPVHTQPIIDQRDVGVLGLLVWPGAQDLHLLMQAKAEPGNVNGVQISPTVQATSSNYTRAHAGRPVPYVEMFRDPDAVTLTDVRQSEQADFFVHKSNRNVAVEARSRVRTDDRFRWLSLTVLHRMLEVDDLVNMDVRTVLSSLPASSTGLLPELSGRDDLIGAVARSYLTTRGVSGDLVDVGQSLGVARMLAARNRQTRLRPLSLLPGWVRRDGAIQPTDGGPFEIIGVRASGHGREVDGWDQPMVSALEVGLAALLVAAVDGVAHALVSLHSEVGYVDGVEFGPSVLVRGRWGELSPAELPERLSHVLPAYPEGVLFDSVQSEEGGRLFRTRTRYLVIESPFVEPGPGHLWLTLGQLEQLVLRGHTVGIETRTLLACVQSLLTRDKPSE
jgi:oxidase EvaA